MTAESHESTGALVTVVTPAYNRADLLGRLRDSLLGQSDQEFDWVVVDDGSTDGTAELLASWTTEPAGFRFEVVTQRNGGKHRALNTAMEHVRTPYLMVVDSDDWLLPDGMRKVREWLEAIDDPRVLGVAGLRLYPDGRPIGGLPRVPKGQDYIECSYLERRRHGLLGDKAEIFRTDVLRRYPYPAYDGEKFLEEAVVNHAIAAEGWRIRWYPQGVYYGEYQPGGLTAHIDRHHRDSFEGYTHYIRQAVALHHGPQRWAYAGVYTDVAWQKGLGLREAAARVGAPAPMMLVMGLVRRALRLVRSARG